MNITLPELALGLQVLSLMAVGIVVERHYVSRITGFTNAIAISIHVLTIPNMNPYLIAYAALGFLLGAIGFVFYAANESTGEWYNLPAYFLYSSWNVLWIIVLPAPMWPWAIAIGVIGQVVTHLIFGNDGFYFGSEPYPEKKVLEEIKEEIRMQKTRQTLRQLGL